MSYRNDHDAALARIDALEAELEKARQTPPPAPAATAPVRSRRTILIATAMMTVGTFGGTYAMLRATHHREADPPATSAPPVASPAGLRACREAIAHVTIRGPATTTPPVPVATIETTGARCRPELAAIAEGNRTYRAWLAAEDELAGDISRITVYYSEDPARLDGYATAAQLWREYGRDLAARDALLPEVDRALGIVHPQS